MANILTILLIVVGALLAILKPFFGLVFIIIVLYFPIFPVFDLGPISISISTLPVLALFLRALSLKISRPKKYAIRGWIWLIMIALLVSFILPTVNSTSPKEILRIAPNLIMYVMIMFSVIVILQEPKDFLSIAQIILILIFIDVLFPGVEAIRNLLGTSGLGINGVVFKYYPAFSIGLVFLTQSRLGISKKWRVIGGVVSFFCVFRTVLFQARAAWIALAVILIISTIILPKRLLLIGIIAIGSVIGLVNFKETFQLNLQQTQVTIDAIESNNIYSANQDDQIRIIAGEFGWRMFTQRPVLGWGPGTFKSLIMQAYPSSRKTVVGGAFNSWLMSLVEMGIVGTFPILIAFILPIFIIMINFSKYNGNMKYLSYAFAAGIVGTGIHLGFIDLLYTSQVWIHLGISLAAVQPFHFSRSKQKKINPGL